MAGVIGSVARFWISGVVAQRYGQTFPDGILTANVWLGHFSVSMINKP